MAAEIKLSEKDAAFVFMALDALEHEIEKQHPQDLAMLKHARLLKYQFMEVIEQWSNIGPTGSRLDS